jgi:hypothetical protein
MKFALSNAQQKQLLLRGQPLLIALPLQRDCETDAAAAQLTYAVNDIADKLAREADVADDPRLSEFSAEEIEAARGQLLANAAWPYFAEDFVALLREVCTVNREAAALI